MGMLSGAARWEVHFWHFHSCGFVLSVLESQWFMQCSSFGISFADTVQVVDDELVVTS